MKKILIILSLYLMMNGCKSVVIPKQIQDTTYFDSKKAATSLFYIYQYYIKHHKYSLPANNMNIKYYYFDYIHKVHSPTKINEVIIEKEISKNQFHHNNTYDDRYQVAYFKNNKLMFLINPMMISSYYNAYGENISVKFLDKSVQFIYDYQHYAECNNEIWSKKIECRLYSRRYGDTNAMMDNPSYIKYRTEKVKNIFQNYKYKFNNKNIFKDSLNRKIKFINYKQKKIIYYFYKTKNIYKVICDYVDKECYINSGEYVDWSVGGLED